jgi:hypothetical protein
MANGFVYIFSNLSGKENAKIKSGVSEIPFNFAKSPKSFYENGKIKF